MENVHYPQRFLQVISWVLGEYSYLEKQIPTESVISKLHNVLLKSSLSSETAAWIMAAITKLASVTPHSLLVGRLIQEFSTCLDTGMRQQACELKALCEDRPLMHRLYPLNSCCEDLLVDASLSFMDGFVAEALSNGAAPYKPQHQRQEEKLSREKALNLEPYGLCFSPSLPSISVADGHSPSAVSVLSEVSGNSGETGHKEENRLKMEGIRKVWGKEGYLLRKESKMSKPESVSPPLESGISMGEEEEPADTPAEPSVELISEAEREKKQLASTLFVGLGSNAVSLMGRPDQTTQKFKRKSRFGKKEHAQPLYSPGDQDHIALTLPNDISSVASRLLPSHTVEEKSVDGKVSSLFANTNLETFPSTQDCSTILSVPSLLPELAQHSHSAVAELASCGTLTMYCSKVWKGDCLLLALLIVNPTRSAITDINLQMEGSEILMVSDSLCCQLSLLEANGVHQCWGSVQPAHPCKKELLRGCVTYLAGSEVPSRLQFSLHFVLSDFIRPLMISTEEFGKMWLTLSNDVKEEIQISSPQQSLSDVLLAIQQALNFYLVEVIGDEGIAACQLMPSVPSLLHCHLQEGMLVVWIRSLSSTLSDYLLQLCQSTLKEP